MARKISRRVERLLYVREDDGQPYVHDFGPGAELWTENDGTVSIRSRWSRAQWREDPNGRRWLVNPPRRGPVADLARRMKEHEREYERAHKAATRYGVFRWTGEGRYPEAAAVRVFKRKADAERVADKGFPELVVRELRNPGSAGGQRRRQAKGRGPRANPRTGATPMARRMPARNAKGRFVKGGGKRRRSAKRARRRRSNPPAAAAPRRRRRRASSRRSAPRRRRNPGFRRLDVMDRILTAGQDALAITAGQAIVRLVPRFLPLPNVGAIGLAVTTATAILAGIAAERVVSKDTARIVTAGAISIPLQAALAQYLAPAVPLVGTALGLGRYANARALSGYSAPNRVKGANGNGRGKGFAYPMAGYDFASAGLLM